MTALVLGQLGHAGLDGQRAAPGHGIAGVHREVEQHLLHLPAISLDGRHVCAKLLPDLDPRPDRGGQQLPGTRDDRVEPQHLGLLHIAAADNEKLLGDPGSALGCVLLIWPISARTARSAVSSATKLA